MISAFRGNNVTRVCPGRKLRVKIPGSPESKSFDQPIQGDSIGSNGTNALHGHGDVELTLL